MSSASSSVDEEAAELRRRVIEKDQETRKLNLKIENIFYPKLKSL